MGPPDFLMEVFLIFAEERKDAFAREEMSRSVSFDSGEVEEGGEEIDHMGRRLPEPFRCRDALRPVGDQGRGNASFMGPGFVFAKRGIGSGGPSRAKAEVGGGGTHGGVGIVAVIADHDFGAGPVVREEEDESVLETSALF